MKFRRTCRAGAFALALLGVPLGQAIAGPIGTTGSFNYTRITGYHTGSGGEFTLFNLNGITNKDYSDSPATRNVANAQSLQTFCLETSEDAASPSYFVVQSAAVRGGTTSSSDPLSKGTAWLYSQFARGTLNVPPLAGYGNYFSAATPSRSNEAGALQQAIWALEGESSSATTANNAYLAAAALQFGGLGGAQASAAPGAYGVYVLVNFDSATHRNDYVSKGWVNGKRQDFLYYVPDGGTTLMLLGCALMGLGAIRRRARA